MHRTTSPTLSIAVAATFAAGLAATSASAAPVLGNVPTFQEFAATTYQDEAVSTSSTATSPRTTGGLRQFYDAMVAPPATSTRTPSSSTR